MKRLSLLLLPLSPLGISAHRKGLGCDFEARNLATIQSIYDLTIFPNNVPIITQGTSAFPPGLLASDISGRVTPVGAFDDLVGSIEYFVGLAPVPTEQNPTIFSEAKIVEFNSGCPDVATSTVYLKLSRVDIANPTVPVQFVTYLKQVAFWRFNDKGEIAHYDAWIPNLQAFVEMNFGGPLSNPAAQAGFKQTICGLAMQRCVGPNVQWNSLEECLGFLETIPFGTFDYATSNTVACRQIHVIMTLSRPDIHCPHVGPTGGGKCVDTDYNTFYFGDEAIFGSPADSIFTCPPKHGKKCGLV
ncbi:hypothetical protein EDB80DRAFT_596284 [Ilyonectria destructans]|nr:hypothetical protein EDB80DRAFT_596284 [Ilyonectria destructans]